MRQLVRCTLNSRCVPSFFPRTFPVHFVCCALCQTFSVHSLQVPACVSYSVFFLCVSLCIFSYVNACIPLDSLAILWDLSDVPWVSRCAFSPATIVDLTCDFLPFVKRSILRLTIRNFVSSFMGFQCVHSFLPSVFAVSSSIRLLTHITACLSSCLSLFFKLLPCVAVRSLY